AVHIFPIASDKKGQLKRRRSPKIRSFLAQVPAGIRERQRVREIEPADIVLHSICRRTVEGRVEIEQIERCRTQKRIIEFARWPAGADQRMTERAFDG